MELLDNGSLLAVLQSGYTTVGVQFCSDGRFGNTNEESSPNGKVYTYKVPTHWNVTIGDWLIVLPSSAFKAVRVCEVHPHPRTLGDNGRQIKWAVQKIDSFFYFNIKNAEEQLETTLHYMRKRQAAERLLEELKKTMPGEALEQITNTFMSLITGSGANAAQPVLQQAQAHTQQPAPQTAASVVQTPATVVQPQVQAEQAQPAQAWQAPAQKPSWAQG
jgi:hypothetical protein